MVHLGTACGAIVAEGAILGQLTRYGIVGVLVSTFSDLLYLCIAAAGTEPKQVMTFLYAVGVVN